MAETNPQAPAPRGRRRFNVWLDRTLATYVGGSRYDYTTGRRADPDSPENIYLREQYEARGRQLKDSRALAERLAEAAKQGLKAEADR